MRYLSGPSKGVLWALVAYAWWGFSPVYWKQLDDVSAVDVLSFRVLATAVLLAGVQLVSGNLGRALDILRSPRTRRIVILSALCLSTNWLLFIWSVSQDRVLETSLGYFINPLVSVALGVVVLKEDLRRPQWIAVLIAACGVLWLTFNVGVFPWVSLVLAATFGLYGLLRKTAAFGSLDGLTVELGVMVPLAVTVIVIRALTGAGTAGWSTPGRDLLLVGSGILTAVPLLLFAGAARRIDLSFIGVLQYLAPTIQFLLGVVIYDENFSGGQVVGYVVIWVALLVFAADSLRNARYRAPLNAL